MAIELTASEKALLADKEAFNASIAGTGWQVREKIIREDLSKVRLVNSSLDDVQLEGVGWLEAVVSESRFTTVQFVLGEMGGAEWTNVVFEKCRFEGTSFSGAKFVNCRFVRCQAVGLKARDGLFENCVFEECADRSGVFGGSTLRMSRFEACKFENTSIRAAELVRISFRHCDLRLVIFGELRGTNLAFEESSLKQCGFVDSEYGNIGMERCTLRQVTFGGFGAEKALVREARLLDSVTVKDCEWKLSMMVDCAAVSELQYTGSRLSNWRVLRCQMAYFEVTNSVVSGESSISGYEVAGFSFEGSKATGLRLENLTLHQYVRLSGARFDGLQLVNVRYGEGVEVEAADVEYSGGSVPFPEG